VNANWLKPWLLGVWFVAGVAVSNPIHAQLNSWSNTGSGTFKWETNTNWSLSIPPASGQSVFITNSDAAMTGFRTIAIDAITSSNFPGAMSVSNLTVSGAPGGGPLVIHNSVFLDNAGSLTPLQIQDSLTISANGAVTITNSVLTVAQIWIDGSLSLNTGTLANINGRTIVGVTMPAQMTVANGTWLASNVVVNSGGTLTLAGGASLLSGSLMLDSTSRSATGTLWMTGGSLVLTNDIIDLGISGVAQMTVSNGTLLASEIALGISAGSWGGLTLAGGTNTFVAPMLLGLGLNATGVVWVTGGQLVIGNGTNYIGRFSTGQMTVSNGLVLAGDVQVASANNSHGVLTIAGGTTTLSGALLVGGGFLSSASVWVSGGQLVVTNEAIMVGLFDDTSQITVSNGVLLTGNMVIGAALDTQGTFTSVGGTTIVTSNLTIGDCGNEAFGLVRIAGGNVSVTNAAHNAVLDVREGSLELDSGTLTVDTLIMTNACGQFIHTGGTLVVGTLLLDPNLDADGDGLPNGWEQTHGLDPLDSQGDNGPDGDPDGDGLSNLEEFQLGTDPLDRSSPYHITAIQREGNNVRIAWMTVNGKTNVLQSAPGTANGSYSNNFTDLSPPIIVPGCFCVATTNYLDVGGATNKPARYYRIRLVP
jgi:hypothetical protein